MVKSVGYVAKRYNYGNGDETQGMSATVIATLLRQLLWIMAVVAAATILMIVDILMDCHVFSGLISTECWLWMVEER